MTIREETVKEKALPKGWRELRLGEVCTFQKGKGLSKKELKEDGKHACILYGELFTKYSGRIKNVISRTNDREEKFLSKKGDILMPSSDVTPKGLATASILYEDGIILGGDIIVIRCTRNQMDGLFFCFFVSANKHSVLKLTSGTTVFHIYKSDLAKLKILLPPLPEQKAIASLLEKWNTAIEKTEALIAAKQKQFEWLVTSLINKSGHKKAHPLSITSHSGFVSSEKREVRLGEIFDMKNGYTPSKAKPEYWTNGTIPWFRMEDIRKNGRILNKSIQCVTPEAVKKGKLFPEDSIIISTLATIGEHALVTVGSLANQQFTFLSKKADYAEKIDMKFFFYYCYILCEWCKNNTNTSSFPSVDMLKFKKVRILVPPILEQKAIVSLLEKAEKEINLLRTLANEYHEQKRGLMQKLLTSKWRLKI